MRWPVIVLAALFLAGAARAADVQARLIRASLDGGATDTELADIQHKLKKVFGYDHYRQLGRKQAALAPATPQRLDLGEGFILFVREKGRDANTYELELEWYSGRTAISKAIAKLPPKTFVFIKGPEVGDDWIILALTVVE